MREHMTDTGAAGVSNGSHYSCANRASMDSDLVLGLCILAAIALAIMWFLKAYAFSNQQVFTILCGLFGALCAYGQNDNVDANRHETTEGRIGAGAIVGAVVGVGICVAVQFTIAMFWFAWEVMRFVTMIIAALVAVRVVGRFIDSFTPVSTTHGQPTPNND